MAVFPEVDLPKDVTRYSELRGSVSRSQLHFPGPYSFLFCSGDRLISSLSSVEEFRLPNCRSVIHGCVFIKFSSVYIWTVSLLAEQLSSHEAVDFD